MKTGISVMDAMTKHPVTIDPSATIKACAEKMQEFNINSLIIEQDGHIVGIITDEDVVRKVVASGKLPEETVVKNIMDTSVTTISPDADIYDAMVKMRDSNIRHLPVTTESKLMGFLTLKDVLKIEPDLFDIIVEQFELREEENKPVFGDRGTVVPKTTDQVSTCEACGAYTESIENVFGAMLCDDCRENQVRTELS
jgi:signal-transduction protein with cAMP-binding, CBS, and nucleotidyltransferase domain